MLNVAAYTRVSTGDQVSSGHGLDAQRDRITSEADRRGWQVTWFVEDAASGARSDRPALTAALDGLKDGRYGALVTAKLDRLTRSVVHLGTIVETAEAQGWSVVLLDYDVDTSKPTGRLVAHVLGQWRSSSGNASGSGLGRPSLVPRRMVSVSVALLGYRMRW